MSANYHIALAADRNFTIPLALCLHSLCQHSPEPSRYHIHLLDGGIQRELLHELPLTISYYKVKDNVSHIPTSGRFPSAIYYRYLLPDILPAEIERVFYLDSDSIILRDLAPLWDIELKGKPIAAAPWVAYGRYREEYGRDVNNYCQRMHIPEDDEPYYYSSMLMMDLRIMRAEGTSTQLISSTEDYAQSLLWPDQDILNLVLRGRITPLPLHYNVIPLFAADINMDSPEAQAAYREPAIIHFAATKPNILTGPKYPFEDHLFQLWQSSPWAREIPYPLASAYNMSPVARKLLYAPIKLCIRSPRLLHAYGRLLHMLRGH